MVWDLRNTNRSTPSVPTFSSGWAGFPRRRRPMPGRSPVLPARPSADSSNAASAKTSRLAAMAERDPDLDRLIASIIADDEAAVSALLDASPGLVSSRAGAQGELYYAEIEHYVY